MFADYTKLFISDSNAENLCETINEEKQQFVLMPTSFL